ncbi:MAG: hypothetical protein KGN78_12730 [Actinomycetales bacterium]|nr:hypothetical protein [Actinomycetales bacterium]
MTGLIYVVIIALWAAVLIPVWLRRHDQVTQRKSAAKFHGAMRSLAPVDADFPDQFGGGQDDYDREDPYRRLASRRRALTLAVLFSGLCLTLGLTLTGRLPNWAPIAAGSLVLTYLVLVAITAPSRAASRVARSQVDEWAYLDGDWAEEMSNDDRYGIRGNVRVDGRWEPAPANLPTYVNAPRATTQPRGIEREGEWGGAAMVQAADGLRRRKVTPHRVAFESDDFGPDTSAVPKIRGYVDDLRRAVNE